MEKVFFKPTNSRSYHIFDTKDNKSLCGKWAMIKLNPALTDPVTEKSKHQEGDCKVCFNKLEKLKNENTKH